MQSVLIGLDVGKWMCQCAHQLHGAACAARCHCITRQHDSAVCLEQHTDHDMLIRTQQHSVCMHDDCTWSEALSTGLSACVAEPGSAVPLLASLTSL